MAVTIRLKDQNFSPSEFVKFSEDSTPFPGFEAGQEFIRFWVDNKQIFDQKTSGSTGKPTIHQIGRSQIEASARRTLKTLDLPTGIQALVCINMAYIGGKMMLARGLMSNWNLLITPPSSNPMENLDADLSIDFAAMVPLQLETMLKTDHGRQQLNRIKKIIVGGAAVSPQLAEALQTLDCQVFATYGMTETVSHIALQTLNGMERSEYFQMLNGISHDLDHRGCLRVKADVTQNKWVQTNDLVEFNTPHTFKVLGRVDHVINTGGLKVATEQLEATLSATGLLGSRNFAIGSMPDPQLGEKIVLILEGSIPSSPNLLDTLKSQLPSYHDPKSLHLIESLPKTQSDKLDRQALKLWLLAQA